MVRRRKTKILSFKTSHMLLCVLSVQAAFAIAIVIGLYFWAPNAPETPAIAGVLSTVAGGLILLAGWTAVRGLRTQSREHDRSRAVSDLMESVLDTSQEWVWAVDGHENFTFSSRASTTLLGYEPDELIGRPVGTVIDPDELASAREAIADLLGDHGSDWTGVRVSYRHRNGAPVWMEVSGRSRPTREGPRPGFEEKQPSPAHANCEDAPQKPHQGTDRQCGPGRHDPHGLPTHLRTHHRNHDRRRSAGPIPLVTTAEESRALVQRSHQRRPRRRT